MNKPKVLTNLITGFFGAGKTTLLQSILEKDQSRRSWAILLNDVGELLVDSNMLGSKLDGPIIEEVPGGCICCSTDISLTSAIRQLIKRSKPDHLLIELSGLGHASSVLVELLSPDLKKLLDLRSILCVVDPRYILERKIRSSLLFSEQIEISDIIVGSRADILPAKILIEFENWVSELPSKPKSVAVGLRPINLDLLELSTRQTILGAEKISKKYTKPRKNDIERGPINSS